MDTQLSKIAEELSNGGTVQPVSVREFLSWFGVQRRGGYIVVWIRNKLSEAGLETIPDFESTFLDSQISFALASADIVSPGEPAALERSKAPDIELSAGVTPGPKTRDPTYRLSKLAAANQAIISVKPDSTLAEAVTLMLARDFSQLPVMTTEREVKGIVSWKSVGPRLALNQIQGAVRDFMDPHHEIRAHFSIFDAIPVIVAHDYVLVRADDNRISGIVTATDLSLQFQALSEPFLLLGHIENSLRIVISDNFSPSELESARDPNAGERSIQSVADLTFGEYGRLLEKPERWEKLGMAIDRASFCADLDRVRLIRNDVMHFDPDGIPSSDIQILRHFANFLERLRAIAQR